MCYIYIYIAICQRRQWHPTPVLWPGESHGWRSLVGCGPWGHWVGYDWATSLSLFTFMIGEGNDKPLQCSCLENPRDGGAWWAAVYGFTQSWTRLKQLAAAAAIYICVYTYVYVCVCVCVYPFPLELPSHIPSPLSCHRVPVWAPCVKQQLPSVAARH